MVRYLGLLLGLSLAAAGAPEAVLVVAPSGIQWKASGSLPPGAEYHLLREDRATRGVQTLVRFPKGYALPEHAHTHDETLFVIRGKLLLTSEGRDSLLHAGSYAVIPAGTPHALRVKGFRSCEMMATLAGPYDLKKR